jgi:hypothetical protein
MYSIIICNGGVCVCVCVCWVCRWGSSLRTMTTGSHHRYGHSTPCPYSLSGKARRGETDDCPPVPPAGAREVGLTLGAIGQGSVRGQPGSAARHARQPAVCLARPWPTLGGVSGVLGGSKPIVHGNSRVCMAIHQQSVQYYCIVCICMYICTAHICVVPTRWASNMCSTQVHTVIDSDMDPNQIYAR